MKKTSILLLAVMLTACGGGGSSSPSPTPPREGTLLSSECNEFTLVERFANGQGGFTEEVTSRSPACGWDPTPYGELSETFCEDPYTLVSVYHDGEYGFYEEREENAETCGYTPESLDVVIDNTFGDRFRPVVVTVDYRVQGEPSGDWTYNVEYGRAVRVDDNTLHIYGDGEGPSVMFFLEINGESYQYQLLPEPRCSAERNANGVAYDCTGYRFRGPLEGFIYYGEDDTTRVSLEVALIYNNPEAESRVATFVPFEDLSRGERQNVMDRLADYQETFDKSGVHIDWVLGGVYYLRLGSLQVLEAVASTLGVDIAIGIGRSYDGTCGVAFPNTSFPTGYPGAGLSRCGAYTDLHEMGHAVGLAHGPQNSSNEASGYIWPDFGHGWNELCSGPFRDLMAYGGQRQTFWNSTVLCRDMVPNQGDSDRLAGDRDYADSAYHWNRIRYDLSIVNDEHNKGPLRSLHDIHVRPQRQLIED